MAKLYNFDRLIDKYSVDFTLVTAAEGTYVGGDYVAGEAAETACRGAIVPMSDSKIYNSGGAYTKKDRQLYMRTPIPYSLKTTKARYKGDLYNIEQATDFDDYANAYIYVMKWVSAVSD